MCQSHNTFQRFAGSCRWLTPAGARCSAEPHFPAAAPRAHTHCTARGTRRSSTLLLHWRPGTKTPSSSPLAGKRPRDLWAAAFTTRLGILHLPLLRLCLAEHCSPEKSVCRLWVASGSPACAAVVWAGALLSLLCCTVAVLGCRCRQPASQNNLHSTQSLSMCVSLSLSLYNALFSLSLSAHSWCLLALLSLKTCLRFTARL